MTTISSNPSLTERKIRIYRGEKMEIRYITPIIDETSLIIALGNKTTSKFKQLKKNHYGRIKIYYESMNLWRKKLWT